MCVVEVEKSSSIYMMAVCLGRLLMGRKRVVVIKGTRDSIQWHRASFEDAAEQVSRTTEDADVFLISESSVIFSFLVRFFPSCLPLFSLHSFVSVGERLFLRFGANV